MMLHTTCLPVITRRVIHTHDTYYTHTTDLPGCFTPQWGHGITLCRPPTYLAPLQSQGSQTIIMLGRLLQSRLNSLVHIFNLLQWTRTLPGELDKSMIYEPFCQQVWWQVCELKWALDDSRDFLSQVCEVWTHLRKLSKEKAEFSPNFMSLAYLKITLWSWPSRSNGCAVLWKLTDDFIRIFKRLLKSIKRYFSVALI